MDQQALNFLEVIRFALHPEYKPQIIEPDFETMCRFAYEQSLLPVFYEGISQMNVNIPDELSSELEHYALSLITSQMQRSYAFLEIYQKLTDAGITVLVMKGIICRKTYEELADHRPSGDEDLYIKREDFYRCRDIFIQNGYEIEKMDFADKDLDDVQEISFDNPETGLHIELHINPFGTEFNIRQNMNNYFVGSFDRCIICNVSGTELKTFNHTDHFLFLFLHLYKHVIGSGVGMRQIIDMMKYYGAYGIYIDMDYILSAVREVKADGIFADVVYIANKYLGFDFPCALAAKCPELLLEDMMESGVFGHSSPQHTLGTSVTMAAVSERKGRIGKFFYALFPPYHVVKHAYPVLLKRPYLLPGVWVFRIGKFVYNNITKSGDIGFKSIAIGQKRVELLKKYGIIE